MVLAELMFVFVTLATLGSHVIFAWVVKTIAHLTVFVCMESATVIQVTFHRIAALVQIVLNLVPLMGPVCMVVVFAILGSVALIVVLPLSVQGVVLERDFAIAESAFVNQATTERTVFFQFHAPTIAATRVCASLENAIVSLDLMVLTALRLFLVQMNAVAMVFADLEAVSVIKGLREWIVTNALVVLTVARDMVSATMANVCATQDLGDVIVPWLCKSFLALSIARVMEIVVMDDAVVSLVLLE